MKVLIKQARIICPSSSYHGSVKDILVDDGVISAIEDSVNVQYDQEINAENLHLSIGWMDIFSNFCDPGEEHKETIESGAAAAAAGGFTDVMLIPNTNPPVSSKSGVEYINIKAAGLPVNIYPIGAISTNIEGKQLAEMYDMHSSGAIAFSDGLRPVQSPGVLLKALQYITATQASIIQLPDDKSVSNHGLMHEGPVSTRLGLPGKPALAEELMISRDIELLKYTGSKLHITGVSTRKGLDLIHGAKQAGLNITCSVAPYQLIYCDKDLGGYDTNLKLNPPLRSEDDLQEIQAAFRNGEIDCIASHHLPQHWDDKTIEFEYAKHGMISLQTVFPVAMSSGCSLEKLVEMLTITPRNIFNIPVPELKTGSQACFTLFNPDASFIFDQSLNQSKSANTPLFGRQLKGKVIGIINKNKTVFSKNG